MGTVAALLLILMGVGIATMWTLDIRRGDRVDLGDGVLRARDTDGGSLLWPHWLAEYTTATLLVVAGVGLLRDANWATVCAALSVGALFYTSVNSLSWALGARDRYSYAAPMVAGIVVSLVCGMWLLVR